LAAKLPVEAIGRASGFTHFKLGSLMKRGGSLAVIHARDGALCQKGQKTLSLHALWSLAPREM